MKTGTESIKVYVASLSDYNAGILHGVWIDLEEHDKGAAMEIVAGMLKASPYATKHGETAEEWAIHDYEAPFKIGEHGYFDTLYAFIEARDDSGDEDAFIVWYENNTASDKNDAASMVSEFQDVAAGSGNTLEDWCEEFCNDTGTLESVPENLRCYFDYEKYARDMEYSGDIWSEERNGTVYVFWNR